MEHQDTGLPAINKMLYIHVMNCVRDSGGEKMT